MRKFAALRVVASFLLVAVPPQAFSKQPAPDEYQSLVERLEKGDTTVDFAELRKACADSPDDEDRSDPDDVKAMYAAYNRGDYSEALKLSQKVLSECYLDIDAHQVAYLANEKMQNEEEAQFHHRIAHGLIDAIFKSGDGKTPETAWVVLTVHEEYVVLRVLQLIPGSQGLMNIKGHSYDELAPIDPKTQQKVTLYFNVDATMKIWKKHSSR
jgi:hypothetical protein